MLVNSKYIDSYKQSHTHMLGVYALIFCFFVFMVMHDYSFFRLGKTYGAWDQMFLFCNELHDIAQFCVCTDV